MTTLRSTSVYTIHVLTAEGRTQAVLQHIADRLPNVADNGESSVSFRTETDDAAALQIATAASAGLNEWASLSLTTGLGIHRRTIQSGLTRRQVVMESPNTVCPGDCWCGAPCSRSIDHPGGDHLCEDHSPS